MQQKSYCNRALFVKRNLVESSMKLRHAASSQICRSAGWPTKMLFQVCANDALRIFEEATVDRNLMLYYTCRLWFELLRVEGSNDVYQTNLAAQGASPQTRAWFP